jgi:hypothetical protein
MTSVKHFSGSLPAVLALALLLLVGLPSFAEVAAEPMDGDVGILILGIIEGPDPIPQVIWEPIRDVDPALILNGDGGPRGDGRPDVAMDPLIGVPHVVWAYRNEGADFDIAHSFWEQDHWSDIEFLTFNTIDQLDPRIYVTDLAAYAVWWEAPSGTLWFSKRPRMGVWSAPEQVVSSQTASRPSVIYWEGQLLFAAERGDGASREIFLSTRLGPSSYVSESVAFLMSAQSLNAILHGEKQKLWVDWCQSPTVCAYSIYEDGVWSAAVEVPAVGPSWVDMEATRLVIRSLVLTEP